MGFWDAAWKGVKSVGKGLGIGAAGGGLLPLLGIGSSLLGAHLGSKGIKQQPISPQEIQGYMQPSQGLINQYGQMGQEMMDPNSARNRQQYQMLEQQGGRQLALQNMLNRRQGASMGQASGITSAQNRVAQAGIGRQTSDLYNQALLQSQQQGVGMMGQQAQWQVGMDENVAQAAIAQRQALRQEEMQRNQMYGSLLGGLGQGLMGVGGGQ